MDPITPESPCPWEQLKARLGLSPAEVLVAALDMAYTAQLSGVLLLGVVVKRGKPVGLSLYDGPRVQPLKAGEDGR